MNREREEAIQVLQTALTSPLIYGEYADAIGMAVEELKAPTGFISKQDVKWQIQEWIAELTEAIDMLDSIPSADRPQGEWIRDRYWSRGTGMGEEYGFFYKCSLCEYEVENGYTRCGFNFCPYCGARMRDEETPEETSNVTIWRYECGAKMEGGDIE